MEKFTIHTGLVAPLDIANVDTDQIIPKQFLQKTERVGFGPHLFHDWRYLDFAGTQDNPKFVLNAPQYKGASILLTRENFGCGSSREHAPWALEDHDHPDLCRLPAEHHGRRAEWIEVIPASHGSCRGCDGPAATVRADVLCNQGSVCLAALPREGVVN